MLLKYCSKFWWNYNFIIQFLKMQGIRTRKIKFGTIKNFCTLCTKSIINLIIKRKKKTLFLLLEFSFLSTFLYLKNNQVNVFQIVFIFSNKLK